ncbi:MAG: hypothetical protein IJB86_06295 [Clostridia bacterium]|nr:hypothetical protein [Clostridia bacterium]
MRKKIASIIAVATMMVLVLSVTAFAGTEEAKEVTLTNYGLITVLFENIKLFFKYFLGSIDKIYLTIAGWFA